MTEPIPARRSLTRIITVRLALTSLLAIALQLTIVVVRTYLVEDDLNRSYVTHQASALFRAIHVRGNELTLKQARIPREYSGKHAAFYAFRVLTDAGRLVEEHNGEMIAKLSPWQENGSRTQDLWLLDLEDEKKLYVAGGVRQKVAGQYFWVEVATFGDPASTYLGIVAAEVADDVWLPMLPLIVLTLGVATLSVRSSLGSLVRAAKQAATLSPLEGSSRLEIGGMPQEAASFATAINGLLDRTAHLVKSQQMFLARAAHELRTPLAIIMLELGRLDDPRMRRLNEDVRVMSRAVDRLLTLARLENTETLEIADLKMGEIAIEIVDRLRDWAEQTQHRLALTVCEPAEVKGDANAIREAIRNLIDNAVRHTPAGTQVHVTVGPGGTILVEDNGPGLATEKTAELLLPFKKGHESRDGSGLGLAIVQQAVDLHHGKVEIGRSPLGGAKFALTFPNLASVAA